MEPVSQSARREAWQACPQKPFRINLLFMETGLPHTVHHWRRALVVVRVVSSIWQSRSRRRLSRSGSFKVGGWTVSAQWSTGKAPQWVYSHADLQNEGSQSGTIGGIGAHVSRRPEDCTNKHHQPQSLAWPQGGQQAAIHVHVRGA